MARDEAYIESEKRIAQARQFGQVELNLWGIGLSKFPESLLDFQDLQKLDLGHNKIESIPEWINHLSQLRWLNIAVNNLTKLPDQLFELPNLQSLNLMGNYIYKLPDNIKHLTNLESLDVSFNTRLTDLPISLIHLENLRSLKLDGTSLNPELSEVYKEGLTSTKRYLLAKTGETVILKEAKLILIGEGEVGKTCLLVVCLISNLT